LNIAIKFTGYDFVVIEILVLQKLSSFIIGEVKPPGRNIILSVHHRVVDQLQPHSFSFSVLRYYQRLVNARLVVNDNRCQWQHEVRVTCVLGANHQCQHVSRDNWRPLCRQSLHDPMITTALSTRTAARDSSIPGAISNFETYRRDGSEYTTRDT